jgi:hypothetical protein
MSSLMKYSRHSGLLLIVVCLLVLLQACNKLQPTTDWSIRLDAESRQPHGLFLTHDYLQQISPLPVTELKSATYLSNLSFRLREHKEPSLIFLIAQRIMFQNAEIDSLFSYVAAGHHLLISAEYIDDQLLSLLGLGTGSMDVETVRRRADSTWIHSSDQKRYLYRCRRTNMGFQQFLYGTDSLPQIYRSIGNAANGAANVVVVRMGKGQIYLHTAPFAFTNYFLLTGNNRRYLRHLFEYIPEPKGGVYWLSTTHRKPGSSGWEVLWRHPSTRLALILAIAALVIYVLFERKRRQKIIPLIKPPENASVAFAETIGRLYFNKKDHTNLARKMIQHFMEYLRTELLLPTRTLDGDFVKLLSAKSGIAPDKVTALISEIQQIQQGRKVTETELQSLYHNLQQYYHGTKRT